MAVKLNKIEIASEYNHLQIREVDEQGNFYRRVLTPDVDVSGEDEKIQESAEQNWTNEVKDKWNIRKEELDQEAREQDSRYS